MQKEMLSFIKENNLSPFNKVRSEVENSKSIFKTRDAKAVFNKVLTRISCYFNFSETFNLWNFFPFTDNLEEIKKRQEFFKSIPRNLDNGFLKQLSIPKATWKPKYGIVVVTEDENTFIQLKKLDCPVQFISTPEDVASLESYDIVQVIDCENSSLALERLPQSVFLDSLDEVYLERYVELLSAWRSNLEVLEKECKNESICQLVAEISPLLKLLSDKSSEKISSEQVYSSQEKINDMIEMELQSLSVSGATLISMLSKGAMPENLRNIVEKAIKSSKLPENLFIPTIPVEVDEDELEKTIKKQSAEEYTSVAENIKRKSEELIKLPEKLKKLEEYLLLYDFVSGVSKLFVESFPEISSCLELDNSKNLFLESPQPISFLLKEDSRCSILTGANSGGKTTLLEHIIQLVSLFQLGLGVEGKIKMPLFTEVYYFAKTKGSANKGAFETLLSQMSTIKPGNKTLILADEIEAVTEPGVAGKIISASCEYFISKGCFLVIATHLGQEIVKVLPRFARIDGIEAKGLDENNELIVDHNPVLGRLAHSTPELIVEKMAKSENSEYFTYLNFYLKKG